jgi:hypothetical protein
MRSSGDHSGTVAGVILEHDAPVWFKIVLEEPKFKRSRSWQSPKFPAGIE